MATRRASIRVRSGGRCPSSSPSGHPVELVRRRRRELYRIRPAAYAANARIARRSAPHPRKPNPPPLRTAAVTGTGSCLPAPTSDPCTSLAYDVFSTESAPPTASARLSLRLNRAGSASTGGGSRRMPLSSLSARDSIPESGASNGPAALRAACDGHSAIQANAAWLTRYRPPRLARACRMSRP